MMRAVILACAALLAGCSSQSAGFESNAPPDYVLVSPGLAGWDEAALAEAVDYARTQNTTGFLILDDGRTITEHNWPLPPGAKDFEEGFAHGLSADGALVEDVASQQKSFVALLVAAGEDRKLVDVKRSVTSYLGAGWSKATPGQEAAITVLHLLEMNSGLKEDFSYEAPAGTKFFYNTPVYAALKTVLEKASDKPLYELTREWLTAPAGMNDTRWVQRPARFAAVGNPTGLATTPRDVARMGEMILGFGEAADGTRVVSPRRAQEMFRPSATNAAYARLWWLNRPGVRADGGKAEPKLVPSAPGDMVAALGAQGRKLYIVPSRKLVVVRMGMAPKDAGQFDEELWKRLSRALPR